MKTFKKIFLGVVMPMILVLAPLTLQSTGVINIVHAATAQSACDSQANGVNPVSATLSQSSSPNVYTCTVNFSDGTQGTVYFDQSGNSTTLNGNQGSYTGLNGTALTQNQTGAYNQEPTDCGSTLGIMTSPFTCMTRALLSLAGASLVSLSSWLMGVAGLLFNWVVSNTIVQFGSIYNTTGVKTGIEAAWTVFRDIANILIIGLFTFIAISIILGLSEFGQKKYVARIIIIAVLINFSLLFTKMIVDFSNFTAGQFYAAAQNTPNPIGGAAQGTQINSNALNPTANTAAAEPTGIAGTFVQMTGVTNLLNTASQLNTVAATNDSALLALLHGVVISVLFVAVALVFLYGSYILIARAIIILILLLTSAIAFATYIIPSQSLVKQGWGTWWSSLISTATLAPILMIMLWATATVAKAFTAASCNGQVCGTLAGLATANPGPTNIQALLSYAIVLGLLYASFYISSRVSHSIAGFNVGAQIVTGVTGIASRFVVAPALRQTVGRAAYTKAGDRGKEAKALATEGRMALQTASVAHTSAEEFAVKKAKAAKEGDHVAAFQHNQDERAQRELAARQRTIAKQREEEAARVARSATRYASVAKSKMNVMNTDAAQTVTKAVGVKGFFAGKSPKKALGYAGAVEAKAKVAQKVAAEVAPNIDEARRQGDQAFRQSREQEKTRLENDRRLKQEEAAAAKTRSDEAEMQRKGAEKERDEKRKKFEDALIEKAQGKPGYNPRDHETINVQPIAETLKQAFRDQLVHVNPTQRTTVEQEIHKTDVHDPENVKKLHETITAAIVDPVQRERSTAGLQQAEDTANRNSAMNQEKSRIDRARTTVLRQASQDPTLAAEPDVQTAKTELDTAYLQYNRTKTAADQTLQTYETLNTAATDLGTQIRNLDRGLGAGAKAAGDEAAKAAQEFRENLVRQVAQQKSSLTVISTDDIAAKAVSIDQRGRTQLAQLTRAIRDHQREEDGGGEESGGAAKTPPAAGH